jgi:hypothetical protein
LGWKAGLTSERCGYSQLRILSNTPRFSLNTASGHFIYPYPYHYQR